MHCSRLIPLALLVALPESLSGQGQLQFAEFGECLLEKGGVIEDCRLGYRTFGELNAEQSNAVLFPTAGLGTTAGSVQWMGPSKLLDSTTYFIVAVDAFGNGVSSSPSNSRTQSGRAFPQFNIRDMVRSQHRLVTEVLGLSSLKAVIGHSLAGLQAFEWAVTYPGFAQKVIPISGSPRLAPSDLILWETELRLVDLLATSRREEFGAILLSVFMHVSRSPEYYARETPRDSVGAILGRLSLPPDMAYNFRSQLQAVISHNVAEPYDDALDRAAAQVKADMLVIVALTDHAITPAPALEFAELQGAETLKLLGDCGHYADWCEREEVAAAVKRFLAKDD